MTISLAGEVVLVTGGARRLGRAIALECARAGASVAITYRSSQQEARETIAELRRESTFDSQRFAAYECDVSDAKQIAKLRGEVIEKFGTLTALVNNAAIFRRTPWEETDVERWEQAFDEHIGANLKGPYMLSKYFGEEFLQQGRGAIVNLADIYGLRPLKNYVPYCISKAGVVMLTQALAKTLAATVRVNCICPGTILVPSQEQGENDEVHDLVARIPLGRLGTSEEIAQAVVFLIGGPQFISGAVLPVDGAELLR